MVLNSPKGYWLFLASNFLILKLIEDDEEVSTLTRKFLESVGLSVIHGCSSEDAMRAVSEHQDFTLLLCDVVLPGSDSGPAIAKLVADKVPDINVLFMSGYSHKEIQHYGVEDKNINLLQKPFRKVDMIKKLKEVIRS
ncbi:MAG: CheY-like chemotaxis protein [Candidatus Azotimanducaceae bacterium]